MNGVIISSESVKPSSPTPQNLRTHTLSFLDHFAPVMLIPVVLYFPHTTQTSTDAELTRLKRSLSLTLTRFYPLAGRLSSDRNSIDCNDEGVPLSVVRFPGHNLSDLLENPDPDLPSSLLPCDPDQCPNSTLALIQLSYFDGGGVAIGAVFSHITVDAATIASFLKSWSAAACDSSTRPVSPDFTAQSMFPQKEGNPRGEFPATGLSSGPKPVTRRYRFDAAAISSLQAKSRGSRVGALAALFWRCYMAASIANDHAVSCVAQPVDLRRRARPALSPDCFGNLVVPAGATSRNEIGIGIDELVKKLRDSVSAIDADVVDRMRGEEGFPAYLGIVIRQANDVVGDVNADVLDITSWCGFGLYSSDFGWGKPVWISPIIYNINRILLMDTRNGDGVEAWVALDGKYMSVFDADEELRALASTDATPLHS